MDDPKALERGLSALLDEMWNLSKCPPAMRPECSQDRREVVRAQYRALHARWMAAKA